MRLRLLYALLLLLLVSSAVAQDAVFKGVVTDETSSEPLYGVSILYGDAKGTTTDFDGSYELTLPAGSYQFTFSYLGYEDLLYKVELSSGQVLEFNAVLKEETEALDLVVVSVSKYEKRLNEETVSVDVLNSSIIENANITRLDDGINKVSSISILDGSVSIRGGSGYAFGSGSRVLLVIDDQPLFTGDRSDIRWNYVPLEIAEQTEVIKGASSALYGASALNGVIHIRTKFPTSEPKTMVRPYLTFIEKPRRKEAAWWDGPRGAAGIFFSHAQKFGQFDLVLGISAEKNQGYIKGVDTWHYRSTFKTRFRPKKFSNLSLGMNGTIMHSREVDFFYFEHADTATYIPAEYVDENSDGTLYTARRFQFNFDPYVILFDKQGNKHSLRTRYYRIVISSSGNKPGGRLATADYQFQKEFKRVVNMTVGTNGTYFGSDDPGQLGFQNIWMGAFYGQAEAKWDNFNMSFGGRWELFRLESVDSVGVSIPVFRFGANYQPVEHTNIRFAFGQGYRFPSIAERFVDQSIGPVNIFPNPGIRPEYGWTSEIGIKQRVDIKDWSTYIDFAFFWTEFWDMVEFQFGIHEPDSIPPGSSPLDYIGFRSENVNRARIAGYEVSIFGNGKIGQVPLQILGGYTYIYPVDLNEDSTLYSVGTYLKQFFKSIGSRDEEITSPMLKYRFRHMFKLDVQTGFKNINLGGDVKYYSFMEGVDAVFEAFIPGIKDYRESLDYKGTWVLSLRGGYKFKKGGSVNFLINNLLNKEYQIRPAKPESPRTFTLQYQVEF